MKKILGFRNMQEMLEKMHFTLLPVDNWVRMYLIFYLMKLSIHRTDLPNVVNIILSQKDRLGQASSFVKSLTQFFII